MKYIGPTKTKPSKRNTAKESWQLLSCSKTKICTMTIVPKNQVWVK